MLSHFSWSNLLTVRSLPYRTTEDTNNVKTPWKILLPLLAQLLDGWQDSFIMRTSLVKVLQDFRDTNPPPIPTYQISKILRCIYFFIFYYLEVGTITEVSYSSGKKKRGVGGGGHFIQPGVLGISVQRKSNGLLHGNCSFFATIL